MSLVSPSGPVYQAGTLSGNPVAMAAGLAMLRQLEGNHALYAALDEKAGRLAAGLAAALPDCCVNRCGSILSVFFTAGPVRTFSDAAACDTAAYARYFRHMLGCGIYLAPAQFEAMFVSAAHTDEDIDAAVKAAQSFGV